VELVAVLSQKARYALRALFMLARRKPGEPVMIAGIAAEARVPRKFLEQILLELKKRGMLHSAWKAWGLHVGPAAEQDFLR
jgi:DNA-binding IscR family transcriptional regulator